MHRKIADMGLDLFLGRFHPLIVHFPIGFLFLAAILEGLSLIYKNRFNTLKSAISITLLCACIGAVIASIAGYLLSLQGGYEEQTLFWHKWFGILVAVFSFIGWMITTRYANMMKVTFSALMLMLVVSVSITGHLGANLTHGPDYLLFYAPASVQKIFGYHGEKNMVKIPDNTDSIQVYKYLIQPVLQARCISCHSETKMKGGLVLSTEDGMLTGGENGRVVEAGNAYESPLFQRTTLPRENKKFMPPTGNSLNFSEQRLIEWWINNGASFDQRLSDVDVPEDIGSMLLRDYGIDTSPQPIYDRLTAPELTMDVINKIGEAGFFMKTLSDKHRLYTVKASVGKVDQESFDVLLLAKEQITWLDLGGKGITNEHMATIGKLENLTRLILQNNPISDQGIEFLRDLKYLESLNVYRTKITDDALMIISDLPSLKRIYLWQTDVSEAGIHQLETARPDLEIQGGYPVMRE